MSHKGAAPGIAKPVEASGPVGVTVCTPGYESLVFEAVHRFRKHSGLDHVVILWSDGEPAFAAKLNLDLLVGEKQIVFFDCDWWALRAFDAVDLCSWGQWMAVHDPTVSDPHCFPCKDCELYGLDKTRYFNSGFFACDLRREEHRAVFAAAREFLAQAHAGEIAAPSDWTDQIWLNLAMQRLRVGWGRLPFSYNFFKPAVNWGSYPYVPREVVGLHAAGWMLTQKLQKLREYEAVFGEETQPMLEGAIRHAHALTFELM